MVIAAGKSGGKPPRITDKAFKPPTEAAMAMISWAGMHGELLINDGLTKFYWALLLGVIQDGSALEIVVHQILTIQDKTSVCYGVFTPVP